MKEHISSRLSELGGVHSMSRRFRARRFAEFLCLLHVSHDDRILDVGGNPDFWWDSGLENQVTILNIQVPAHQPAPFRWVQGDACRMDMFNEREFDVVFSSSVIEHVGQFADQQRMADEVRRVGEGYWVQICLLDCHEMQSLFPDAEIRRERAFPLVKSLIAVRVRSSHNSE